MDSYSFEGQHNMSFEILEKNDNNFVKEEIEDENKIIWKKIKNLEFQLHTNNISNKSACFWCTYDFENPSIYIPKYRLTFNDINSLISSSSKPSLSNSSIKL